MTPTLYGRWQTRTLLTMLPGLPLTATYAFTTSQTLVPFILLGYALLLGVGWDLLYNYLQSLRWNRDWPPLFALYAGLWEGSCLFLLSQLTMPMGRLVNSPVLVGVIGLAAAWHQLR